MNDSRTFTFLALLGAVPFAAGAVLPLVGVASIEPIGDITRALAIYGLTILCFLTGIHWATQLYRPESTPFNLFVVSNVVFLIVLGAFLAAPLNAAMGVQILAFIAVLAIDIKLQGAGLLASPYMRIRYIATGVACLSLLVAILT